MGKKEKDEHSEGAFWVALDDVENLENRRAPSRPALADPPYLRTTEPAEWFRHVVNRRGAPIPLGVFQVDRSSWWAKPARAAGDEEGLLEIVRVVELVMLSADGDHVVPAVDDDYALPSRPLDRTQPTIRAAEAFAVESFGGSEGELAGLLGVQLLVHTKDEIWAEMRVTFLVQGTAQDGVPCRNISRLQKMLSRSQDWCGRGAFPMQFFSESETDFSAVLFEDDLVGGPVV